MLLTVGLDVEHLMDGLAAARPLFHSEADLQHALAWQAHVLRPGLEVRLECRPAGFTAREALDLLVRDPITGSASALELKYPTRALKANVAGEEYQLTDQAAQDITRYDVIKDLVRIERVVAARGADDGMVLVLTNDGGYWRQSQRQTVDQAFRLHHGGVLAGELSWSPLAGPGTRRAREAPHRLAASYELTWRDYSVVSGQTFRWLGLHVTQLRPNHASAARS